MLHYVRFWLLSRLVDVRCYLASLYPPQAAPIRQHHHHSLVTTAMNEKPTHVWIFDENRRVSIWRDGWRRREITGETSRSWIVEGYPELKIPKNPKTPQRHLAWSEKELDQLCWLHEHRYRIIRNVEFLPAAELIKVASLIGYEPSPPA